MKKLSLPNVTLCAATNQHIELTYRAMIRCLEACDFGDVVFLSPHERIHQDKRIRYKKMDSVSNIAEVAIWHYKNLHQFTNTEFNLLIHWDSWIINASAWNDQFFDYDYIGAPWPWYPDKKVGNEGFCLRSKKMLQALSSLDYPPSPNFLGDNYICREIRPMLEKTYGIRFATDSIADLFAYECLVPNHPTFGFHGLGCMLNHLNDAEMKETISLFDNYMFSERKNHLEHMINIYKKQNKKEMIDFIKEIIKNKR